MRCVKLTLPRPGRERWLFRICRLTSSSFAGTLRTEVAVGTPRLASMFSTIRAAAPRIGFGVSPSRTSGGVPAGVRGSGGGSWRSVTDGAAAAAGGGAGTAAGGPSPAGGGGGGAGGRRGPGGRLLARGDRGRGGGRRWRCRCRGRGAIAVGDPGRGARGDVVGEELLPRRCHRAGVRHVLAVHLVDES